VTVTDAHDQEMNREALRRDVRTVEEEVRVDAMRVKALEGEETDRQAASIQARTAAIAAVAAILQAVARVEDQGEDVETKHAELMNQQVETYLR